MLKSKAVQRFVGKTFAQYFRFVAATSRMQGDMQPHFDEVAPNLPAIFTFWHGEQFLIPTAVAGHLPFAVLVSRHGDGEIQAAAMEAFGVPTIRGSGGRDRRKTIKKGGIQGAMEIISHLEDGVSVGMTAQVSGGASRKVGKGVVTLAKLSGRPIYPIAYVTNRNWFVESWDKAAINKPFSRSQFALGEKVCVPDNADDEQLENARQMVEDELVRINKSARDSVGAAGQGREV